MGGPGGIGSRNALPGSQQDLEASAGDRVFFAFDRSDITPEAQEILSRQADWLRRYPNATVTIEGHCDERGTREYNLVLGDCRAQAVKNVLGSRSGIPASRISTISYGKERPAVVGSSGRGVCAGPLRRDHRELKDGTAPVISSARTPHAVLDTADWSAEARPFFALNGP